ncbi:hypothetical protein ABPG73_016628 [Tetrahymena malaccensis]
MNVYHATLHAQIVKVLQKATVQIVSKICNSIINSPRIDPNNEKFPKANLKQKVDNRLHIQNLDQDYQQKQNDNQNKENEFEKQSNELNQEQNNQEENQIQNFLEQIMQMQVTTKNVITRKNNQSSFQVLEYQQTDQESKHQYQSKISSQIMPTIGTIANLNQINNQQAIDNQEEEKDTSQQQSYAADNKFKFTIICNSIINSPRIDPNNEKFPKANLKQKVDNRLHIQNLDQDYQQKQNENENNENEFENQSNQIDQEQNNQEENQIQNFLEQIIIKSLISNEDFQFNNANDRYYCKSQSNQQ